MTGRAKGKPLIMIGSAVLISLIALGYYLSLLAASRSPTNRLIHAVKQGDTAAVKATLGQGADPNARVVYQAAWWDLTENAEAKIPYEVPVLVEAVSRGHGYVDIVEALLDAGADPNAKTICRGIPYKDGLTALMIASNSDVRQGFVPRLRGAGAKE